jgi:hypothetical protein
MCFDDGLVSPVRLDSSISRSTVCARERKRGERDREEERHGDENIKRGWQRRSGLKRLEMQ